MGHSITIAGKPVELSWSQDVAKRMAYRASQIGGGPKDSDFGNPRKAAAAVTALLWMILPPKVHSDYDTPEDLFVALDHENDAEAIHEALAAIVAEMSPSEEKKSTLKKSPSHKSS